MQVPHYSLHERHSLLVVLKYSFFSHDSSSQVEGAVPEMKKPSSQDKHWLGKVPEHSEQFSLHGAQLELISSKTVFVGHDSRQLYDF